MEATTTGLRTQDREQIASKLRIAMANKLEPEKIELACEHLLLGTSNKFLSVGNIRSAALYLEFQVVIEDFGAGRYDKMRFEGKAGCATSFGFGAFVGDIYTDDLEMLIKSTSYFKFICTSMYTCLIFFDSSSHCLGSYQSGSSSMLGGTGSGSGTWQ